MSESQCGSGLVPRKYLSARTRDTELPPTLSRHVKDSAALLTVDNFLAGLRILHRGSSQFHVATGANAMLDRDDGRVALASEQSLEPTQQIFIHLFRQFLSLF